MLQPLAEALGISLIELVNGQPITNRNVSGNMLRCKFYVRPLCGNVIYSLGDSVISCCGVTLPPCEAEASDDDHEITLQRVEDKYFLTICHSMTKEHFIFFVAYVTSDQLQLVKLYPEGNTETRLQIRGRGNLYCYCNRHGLMKKRI